jgi:hypothetical protein
MTATTHKRNNFGSVIAIPVMCLAYLLFCILAIAGLPNVLLKSPEDKDFEIVPNPHQQEISDACEHIEIIGTALIIIV